MSIAKIETSALSGSVKGGKSKTMGIVIGVLITAGLVYLGYKYVYLPVQAKKNQNEEEA